MNRRVQGRHRNIEIMKFWFAAALALSALACGSSRADDRDEARATVAPPAAAAPAESSASNRPRIVVLGDSLTAGLGLPADRGVPVARCRQRLKDDGLDYEVVNAGVSGDTSAGGLARLDWALQGDVRVLIVALGGNDALRGLPAEQLQHNLAQIIERAQARSITVDPRRDGSAAELRARLHRRLSQGVSGAGRDSITSRSCRSCCRASPGARR